MTYDWRSDLAAIRKALYSGQISAAKVDGQRAFDRVHAYIAGLENALGRDVQEAPFENPFAPGGLYSKEPLAIASRGTPDDCLSCYTGPDGKQRCDR